MEETIRKLTDGMNELIFEGRTSPIEGRCRKILLHCVVLLRSIDKLCDIFEVEMPEEAVSANITLDEYFGYDILTRTLN